MNFLQEVERYNQNWNIIRKSIKGITFQPDRDDIFVCPLCFRYFLREEWNKEYLSIEHVPPQSLGGKAKTITCRKCNNDSGHLLDIDLVNEQKLILLLEGGTDESMEVTYRLKGMDSNVIGTFSQPEQNSWKLIGIPERTNPEQIRKISELPDIISSDESSSDFVFTISFRQKIRDYRPHIAKLRIAYLWAFSVFGYSLLMNKSYQTISNQLRDPQKKIMSRFWQIQGQDIPQNGIYAINAEDLFTGFIVCFELQWKKNRPMRYAFVVPAPYHDSFEKIEKFFEASNGSKVEANLKYIDEAKLNFGNDPFLSHEILNYF